MRTASRCTPIPGGFLCEIGYVKQAEEGARRVRRGERQLYCGVCEHWVWPEECRHAGRLTAREFRSMVAAVKKQVEEQYPSDEVEYRRELAKAWREGQAR